MGVGGGGTWTWDGGLKGMDATMQIARILWGLVVYPNPAWYVSPWVGAGVPGVWFPAPDGGSGGGAQTCRRDCKQLGSSGHILGACSRLGSWKRPIIVPDRVQRR